jgi:hypothetical protein
MRLCRWCGATGRESVEPLLGRALEGERGDDFFELGLCRGRSAGVRTRRDGDGIAILLEDPDPDLLVEPQGKPILARAVLPQVELLGMAGQRRRRREFEVRRLVPGDRCLDRLSRRELRDLEECRRDGLDRGFDFRASFDVLAGILERAVDDAQKECDAVRRVAVPRCSRTSSACQPSGRSAVIRMPRPFKSLPATKIAAC